MQSQITRRAALSAAGGALALSATTLPAMAKVHNVDPHVGWKADYEAARAPGGAFHRADVEHSRRDAIHMERRRAGTNEAELVDSFNWLEDAWQEYCRQNGQCFELLNKIAETAPRTLEGATILATMISQAESEQVCSDDAPLNALRSLAEYFKNESSA